MRANFSPSSYSAHCLRPTAIHRLCLLANFCARRSAITAGRSGLEWEVALVAVGGVRRRGTAWWAKERCGEKESEHRGCWEKIGTGSPFNLLINHANEILTGYSEAVLGGGKKALVLDYTLSMWRAKKEKGNMLLNKVMGNFLAHGSQAEPLTAGEERNVFIGMHTKTAHRLYTVPWLTWTYALFQQTPGHISTTNHTFLNCTWCNQACNIVQFTMAMPNSYMSAVIPTNLTLWQTMLLHIIVHLSLSWSETTPSMQSQAWETASQTEARAALHLSQFTLKTSCVSSMQYTLMLYSSVEQYVSEKSTSLRRLAAPMCRDSPTRAKVPSCSENSRHVSASSWQ